MDRGADTPVPSTEKTLDLAGKRGKITRDRNPHLVQIQSEVLVNEDVAHGDDFRPLHFRMRGAGSGRNASGSLPDHLQVMDHPDLQQFIGVKQRFFRSGSLLTEAPHRDTRSLEHPA